MMNLNDIIYVLKSEDFKDKRDYTKFMGACLHNVDKTKSQNYQDVWALYETDFKQDGFFIEFGATNGIDGSNTYLLQKNYYWHGILVEPNPDCIIDLTLNRLDSRIDIINKCVHTVSGQKVEFLVTNEPDLSTIKGYGQDEHTQKRKNAKTVVADTISLHDLLDLYAPSIVDYLSIDTEGSEYDILNAYFKGSSDHKINMITVEHNYTPARELLSQLLTENGYIRVFTEFSRWDDFYILKEITRHG